MANQAKASTWSPPRHAVTVHAGFDLVFFGGTLMFGAIVCAIWALWQPLMLLFVVPFAACAALAWWRWLSYNLTVDPRGLRVGRMLGGALRIPFQEMSRVRFLRAPQRKAQVNWTSRIADAADIPFEKPPSHRPLVGAPLQVWIERRGKSDVRLNLDFLGSAQDIKLLYEALPHVVAVRHAEPSGPSESLPRWW